LVLNLLMTEKRG